MRVIQNPNVSREKRQNIGIGKWSNRNFKTVKVQIVQHEDSLRKLVACGSRPPRLYSLLKVLKVNVSLKPELGMDDSAYHSPAQWITELLEPVPKDFGLIVWKILPPLSKELKIEV